MHLAGSVTSEAPAFASFRISYTVRDDLQVGRACREIPPRAALPGAPPTPLGWLRSDGILYMIASISTLTPKR